MTPAPSDATVAPRTPALELVGVSKLYGSFAALRNVSLALPTGASVVLLGPNGAGKSTLLRLLAGLSQPTYGEIRVHGRAPLAQRGRVATMGHTTMLYDELTAAENLSYLLGLQRPELHRFEQHRQVRSALAEVALDPDLPQRLGEYSQGMRQRASLARVLLGDPDVLLLDEPFSNLDTSSVQAMIQRLQRYLAEPSPAGLRRTLVLTTHQAELARPLAHLTLLLANGSLSPALTSMVPSQVSGVLPQGTPIA